jgi:hypothetical protein
MTLVAATELRVVNPATLKPVGALEALYGNRLRGLWRERRALLALGRDLR